jgi:peptidoglycan-associated lipoprotein
MKRFLLTITAGFFILTLSTGCGKQGTKISEVSMEPREAAEPRAVIEPAKPVQPAIVPEEKKEVPKVELTLRSVHFNFDKYDLRSDAREILADHARVLQQNPEVKLIIEGHCDERGTIEYNLALGDRRANAVRNYLINYGISPDRLATISYGKERPVDRQSNEEAWAKNRRAEFVIKKS